MFVQHSEIETPDDEVNLWRYLTIEKFLFLVTRSELYFCRSDTLQDPWEGVWPKKVIEALRSEKFAEAYSKDTGQQILAFSDNYKKTAFMNCWYNSSHESAAMWGLYSTGCASVAIRSTIGRLKKGIICEQEFHIGKVKYLDYDKEAVPQLNMLIPFFTKRKSFEHEREVRILINIIPVENGKIDWSKAGEEILAKVDLETLISEVYVSPTAPSWLSTIIQEILKRFGLGSKKVHQSNLYEPCVY